MNGLKVIREKNNLTQTEIAKILNISVQRYNSYEKKRRKLPVEIAMVISELFNVSLKDVFFRK